jgi:hypothetical protein
LLQFYHGFIPLLLQAFNYCIVFNLRLGLGFVCLGLEQGDLRVPFLQLRLKLFFVGLSFFRHGNLLVVENVFDCSAIFSSHDQQYRAVHGRNSFHDRLQRKNFRFSAVICEWAEIKSLFSYYLSRRLHAPPLNDIEQNNNNSNYQQDMDEPSHRVTADQSQRPQNYQYHSNCPQHNDPPFLSVGESRRLMKCGCAAVTIFLC